MTKDRAVTSRNVRDFGWTDRAVTPQGLQIPPLRPFRSSGRDDTGSPSPCVKVVFPLRNGNAVVLLKVEAHADGSLSG